MKNILLITIIGLFLISATVVTTTQIVQPKQPIDIQILKFDENTDITNMNKQLNTYRKYGYIIKHFCVFQKGNSYSEYSIKYFILEKYQ